MQRPQPRIVRHEANQGPRVRIDSQRVPTDGIRHVQPRVVRRPVEDPRPRLHDPELVAVQVERVRALVQAVDEQVHDRDLGHRDHELRRAEGAAQPGAAEGRVAGVQARDGLVERRVFVHGHPGGRVYVGAVEGVGADLEGDGYFVEVGGRGRGLDDGGD